MKNTNHSSTHLLHRWRYSTSIRVSTGLGDLWYLGT